MKNKKRGLIPAGLVLFFMLSFLVVPVVLAQDTREFGPDSPDALVDLVKKVAGYFQMIVLVIAIIIIIYAAFLWMTASGDEEKLKKARKTFIWGLVGIGIALFAYVAETFIESTLGS